MRKILEYLFKLLQSFHIQSQNNSEDDDEDDSDDMTTSDDNENENVTSQSQERSDIAAGINIIPAAKGAEGPTQVQGKKLNSVIQPNMFSRVYR